MQTTLLNTLRVLACLIFMACSITSGINVADKGVSTTLVILTMLLVFTLLSTTWWIVEGTTRHFLYPWSQEIWAYWKRRRNKKKPTILPPVFDSIEEYTRKTFYMILSPDEIDRMIRAMKFFAVDFHNELDPPVLERTLPRMTTLDFHHFGWNIGKRLNKTSPAIAHFLKTQFPVIFKNSTESTIKKKLKNDDGNYFIEIIELESPLTPVNLDKLINQAG